MGPVQISGRKLTILTMAEDVIHWEPFMEISYHKMFVDPDPGFLKGQVERPRCYWGSVRLEDCKAVWEWKSGL